ncbi:MAG: YihY/virulence factor BrkB family protein [Planctomycetes bacterium]|nr:YihY/virulence factor BrkB family protein [Planctomycetota bacterium]
MNDKKPESPIPTQSGEKPVGQIGRWTRFARFNLQLGRFCFRRLIRHNASAMSAALSYCTLFAMVPVLALTFLVLKSAGAGVVADGKQSMRQLLTAAGFAQIARPVEIPSAETPSVSRPASSAPASAPSAAHADPNANNFIDRLEGMVDDAVGKLTFASMGIIGLLLLAWAAGSLLDTMEDSLNRIFEAPRSRSLGRRIATYWSLVTLVPVVLGVFGYLSNLASKACANVPLLGKLVGTAGWLGNFIVMVLLLAFVYKAMPNTQVRYRAAIGGAFAAVPLWLIAKWGFALYISELVGPDKLYGNLGLIPLFLLWVNLSWWIFLFGAEFAHTAVNLTELAEAELAERILMGPSEMLAAAAAVAGAYIAGKGAARFDRIAQSLALPDECVNRLLEKLIAAGMICKVDSDPVPSYIPAKPVESIRVVDVVELAGSGETTLRCSDRFQPDLARIVGVVRGKTRHALGETSLAQLLSENNPPAK